MTKRDKLKQDIARLVLHPRFCGLRAYFGGSWECDVERRDDKAQIKCISGDSLAQAVEAALRYLRSRS